MLWVPVLKRVSVTSMIDVEPERLRTVIRSIHDETALALVFEWQRVRKPIHTFIPGRCASLMHANNEQQYSIVGWS